jgi:hypothetical protein
MTTPHWHGVLCSETRNSIATRMHDILEGNFFTMVLCNSFDENSRKFSSVDVYPSQRMSGFVINRDITGISWSTSNLSMGVHTDARTRSEGVSGRPHQYVHFAFEPGRFVIEHYAPAGYFLRWIFAVEHHESEEFDD